MKIWAVWAIFLDNYARNLASKWFKSKKTAQKPRKIWTFFRGLSKKKTLRKRARFERFFLQKKTLKTVEILSGFWAFFFR